MSQDESETPERHPDEPHAEAIPTVSPGGPRTAAAPPSDATVLLSGGDLSDWESVDDGGPARWRERDGYVEVAPETGHIRTLDAIGDCQLHLEWAAPPRSEGGRGQQRGNSGVFFQERYEVQILDNYENITYPDGYCGAIYGQHSPTVNACLPPEEWQSLDVVYHGPRFDGETVTRPARMTVIHNGVLVQDDVEISGPTSGGGSPYEPHPAEAPLMLQDHLDPVRYRNIWYRPLD